MTDDTPTAPTNRLSRPKTTLLLGLIVLIALVLRLWGVTFGLPGKYRPDEEYLVGTSLGFLSPGTDYDPHFFIYPSFFFYILGLVFASCKWGSESLGMLPPGGFMQFLADFGFAPGHLIGRATSVFFGAIAVLPLFHLVRRSSGTAAGLLAALLLAGNYVHARESHFATTDACCFFFSALALAAIYGFAVQGRFRDVALAGGLVGLAISSKYPALCLFAPLGVAHLSRLSLSPSLAGCGRQLCAGILGVCCAAATFALTSPFVLIDHKTVAENFAYQQAWVRDGLPGLQMDFGWRWIILFALRYGAGYGLCAAAVVGSCFGLVASFRTRSLHPSLMFVAFFAVQYIGLSGSHLLFFRYILLSMLALIPLAAFGIVELSHRKTPWGRFSAGALVLWCLASPLWRIVQTDRILTTVDTRNTALAWIRENIPAGSAIAVHSSYYYGKPELPRGWTYTAFDTLTHPAAGSPQAKFLLIDRHPITMFSPHPLPQQTIFISERMKMVRTIEALAASSKRRDELIFDPSDAFYVPLDGFAGAMRAGPSLEIYRLAD